MVIIKQINQLETELGFRLFERTHRGLTLTKAGESLYQDAKYFTEYFQEAVNSKNFGVKPWVYPQPVLIIGTYDADDRKDGRYSD